MKIQRHIGLPEGDMAIILDNQTLIHNIVTNELEQKDKEIERLNNIKDGLKKYLLERLFEYKNCKNKENINHLAFKLLILKLLDKIDECSGDDSNDS